MKRNIWVLLIVALSIGKAFTQDAHWSMIQWNPIYLNPANTGFADKANRLTGIYRDQWRSIPVPFSTTHASYDRRVIFNEEKGIRFGLGGSFLYDKSGDGALSQFIPQISGAFGKYFHQNKQVVSLGVQAGVNIKTLDFSQLTFDNQYNGSTYDPNLPTGEILSGENALIPVFGFGLNFNTQLKKSGGLDLGGSYYNPHSPNYNFLTNSEEELPGRLMAYTKADIKLGAAKKWELNPGIFFQLQGKNQELLMQSLVSYNFATKNAPKLSIGPGYRLDDAVVAYAALKIKDLRIGFAFDGNVSDLKQATSGRGAYEVTLNYEWEKKKKEIEIKIDTTPEIVVEEKPEPKVEVKKDTVVEVKPVVVKPEPPKEDPMAKKERELQLLVEKLQAALPLKLYFDNDKPLQRSTNTTTTLSYGQTYNDYLARKEAYAKNYGTDGTNFINNVVTVNYNKFNEAMGYVKTLLENGKSVNLNLKGYASPLAPVAYNEALSNRRISCVENEIKSYMGGVLNPYITAGKLKLANSPMGEGVAPTGVSDKYNDPKNSIYNPAAAGERRVEVIAIDVR